tara:strand:- start:206 stop:337 length:132 start_codon:yes stop_codon:yes gene_type:complete
MPEVRLISTVRKRLRKQGYMEKLSDKAEFKVNWDMSDGWRFES